MNLRNQKRISAKILGVGKNRVWFDSERLQDIKEAITKADLVSLIKQHAIKSKPKTGHSQGRTRHTKLQKRKGRQKERGSRKGKKGARLPQKRNWINKIRQQRALLKRLKTSEMVTLETYHDMYRKTNGGFFRSVRHIKGYLNDHGLIKKAK